jgi:hypothetical protein
LDVAGEDVDEGEVSGGEHALEPVRRVARGQVTRDVCTT